MNLDNISRMAKTAAVSLAMMLGLSSCNLDYTVGYVYMTTAKSNPGVIDEYGIDYDSGALTEIGTINAGNNPVRILSAPNGRFVYVINQGASSIMEFAVQGNGTLSLSNTYQTGAHPTALAIDPQGAFLYVAFSYQNGSSGPGGVDIFPVNGDNSLGTPSVLNVGNNPVGVTVSYYNHFVYVLDQETVSPQILGFSQNTANGALTPLSGTTIASSGGKTVATGYPAGVVPSAIAEEPTARFVYVTDEAANQLIAYTVQPNGNLLPMVNGPFPTGLFPVNLTIDPTGRLIYVVDYNQNTVQGYMIDEGTGSPSAAVGAFATSTGAGPTCIAIDPSLGTNMYISNSLDNTITAERVAPDTGGLLAAQNSPFLGDGQPTCVAIVPNGAHSTEVITP